MTNPAGPTYLQTLTEAEQENQIVLWRAAQTVRAQVPDHEGQHELLGALGLLDVQRPAGLL